MLYKRSWLLALLLVTALVFAACAAPVAAPSGDTGAAMEAEGGDEAAAWIAQSGMIVEIWYEEERE